ncbi:MAG: hypothetical protein KIS83_01090 [Rubrivivax sp.]|nr:hypothetical protein [Rubrivivax sp.]
MASLEHQERQANQARTVQAAETDGVTVSVAIAGRPLEGTAVTGEMARMANPVPQDNPAGRSFLQQSLYPYRVALRSTAARAALAARAVPLELQAAQAQAAEGA